MTSFKEYRSGTKNQNEVFHLMNKMNKDRDTIFFKIFPFTEPHRRNVLLAGEEDCSVQHCHFHQARGQGVDVFEPS